MESLTLTSLFAQITEQQNLRGKAFCELSDQEKRAYANEAALALFVEVGELVSSWPFASWKTTSVNRENIKRELVDILFFVNIIKKTHNISTDELESMFRWVLENNARRMASGEHAKIHTS